MLGQIESKPSPATLVLECLKNENPQAYQGARPRQNYGEENRRAEDQAGRETDAAKAVVATQSQETRARTTS